MSGYQDWKRAATAMIDHLPDEGAVIIVATNDLGRTLRKGIVELRGKDVARKCRLIAAHRHCDCPKLEGLRGPVVIDSSVERAAKPDVVARIKDIVAGANAVVAPTK